MNDFIPYEKGQPVSNRYAWWATKEIGHQNKKINDYAILIGEQYQRLENGEITVEEFELNTPEIDEETPLNYIRNCIIHWHPN